jgi:hypothetical protein
LATSGEKENRAIKEYMRVPLQGQLQHSQIKASEVICIAFIRAAITNMSSIPCQALRNNLVVLLIKVNA